MLASLLTMAFPMENLFWILIVFVSGALQLSLWLGRLALGTDVRQFGDGNPSGANVWLAGSSGWGMLAISRLS